MATAKHVRLHPVHRHLFTNVRRRRCHFWMSRLESFMERDASAQGPTQVGCPTHRQGNSQGASGDCELSRTLLTSGRSRNAQRSARCDTLCAVRVLLLLGSWVGARQQFMASVKRSPFLDSARSRKGYTVGYRPAEVVSCTTLDCPLASGMVAWDGDALHDLRRKLMVRCGLKEN